MDFECNVLRKLGVKGFLLVEKKPDDVVWKQTDFSNDLEKLEWLMFVQHLLRPSSTFRIIDAE